MKPADFAHSSRVKIIIGKGGVGKTAVTCAIARACAASGLSALIIELEGRPEIAQAFGADQDIAYGASRLYDDPSGGSVDARLVTPDDALVEYLGDHSMGRLSHRLMRSGALDVVSGAIPGIREVLVLGKIKQIANESDADIILVDAPATGHAVTLLTSAAGVAGVARAGPVRRQADEVVQLLSDPDRCQVVIVTIPEELPVTEAIEAAFLVEDRAGVALGPVFANRVDLPEVDLAQRARAASVTAQVSIDDDLADALDAAAAFSTRRAAVCTEQLDRLRAELPLDVIELPRLASARLGPLEIGRLADAVLEGLDSLGGTS